ncbi:MAG: TIR domain-containing protein, partial [Dehalococcoidia bacterium]
AGQVQPLVLVLEDLHDADRGTLELLQFLARQLTGTRLLVVGTYRDVEVDRAHPLSATLAELQRGASFVRVRLRGLTADEVQRMIAAIAGQDVTWRLAEAVYRQTEGNPLFVQEVVRYLAESGLVERKDGRWQAPSAESLLTSIPEGLRDVIGKRLARLTPPCNQLLTVAAIIGREFELRTLQAVAGVSDDALAAALDEALKVAILQDQSRPGLVRYRFAHAFFRQTLYDEVITPRRLRLHQQIARALEAQYAGRLDDHAAELADHFAQSSDPADLGKAVQYGRLAAQRARAVYAHGEAVRLLEQALAVQEVADPDGKAERCAVLLQLAETLLAASEPYRAAKEVAEAAYELAEGLGDRTAMLRACRTGTVGMLMGGQSPAMATSVGIRWVERMDTLAPPGTAERAIADAMLAHVCWVQRRYGEMHRLLVRALATAREVEDEEVLWLAGWGAVWLYGAQDGEAWRLLVSEEFATRERRGASTLAYCATVWIAGEVLLNWGRRPEAEAAFGRVVAAAEQSREVLLQISMAIPQALLLRIEGRLAESIDCAQRMARGAEELGSRDLVALADIVMANRSRALLGRVDDDMLRSSPWWQVVDCLAILGRVEEGRTLLWQALQKQSIDEEEFRANYWIAAWLLEAAVLLGDADAAQRLARRLDLLAGTACSEYAGPCIPRLLGGAAALNDDRDGARAYYEQALETAGRIGYRPEIALTHFGLAELLNPLSPGGADTNARAEASERDLAEAREHLAFCIAEFEAMGMAPALERARALQARLSPPSPPMTVAAAVAVAAEVAPVDRAGQVFISYSSEDRAVAFALEATLTAEDIPVWLDKRSIAAGSSWDAAIVEGIKQSAVVVVFVSPKAVASDNVRQELRLALQYKKPILPLLLEPTTFPGEVEYVLAGRQWIEVLDHAEDDWFPQVLAAVRRLA